MKPPLSIRPLKGKRQKKSLFHVLCSPSLRGIKFPGTSISCSIVAVALVTPEVSAWSDMPFSIYYSRSVFGIKFALCVKSSPVTQQSPFSLVVFLLSVLSNRVGPIDRHTIWVVSQ